MKTLDIAVHFTIEVEDDVEEDGLYISVDEKNIEVYNDGEPVKFEFIEYETVNVDDITEEE